MNKAASENHNNEFSRIVNLDIIEKKAIEKTFEATKKECELLAKRFSIVEIAFLKAHCVISKRKQKETGDYLLRVNMEAEIVQKCVMTLKNVNESISEKFKIIFEKKTGASIAEQENVEITFDLEDDDLEQIDTREVDIGEYIAEYLSLYMNVYPRIKNIKEEDIGYQILNEDEIIMKPEKKNPFAVLKDLKHNT